MYVMHVQENASDLSFGDTFCRNFIGGGPVHKMTRRSNVWNQYDVARLDTDDTSNCLTGSSDMPSSTVEPHPLNDKDISELPNSNLSNNDVASGAKQSSPNILTTKKDNIFDTEKGDDVNSQCKICQACKLVIASSPICVIDGVPWHEECLSCAHCGSSFNQSCFVFREQLYCRADYQRIRHRCDGCGLQVDERELSVPASYKNSSYNFHIQCCVCATCKRSLRGEECHIVNEDLHQEDQTLLQCSSCWESRISQSNLTGNDETATRSPAMSSDVTDMTPKSPSCMLSPKSTYDDETVISSEEDYLVYNIESVKDEKEEIKKNASDIEAKDRKGVKRPRTILTVSQRNIFKTVFETTQKPNKKQREELAKNTGLTARVVQVWFQNQRAKIKKLSKRQQHHGAAGVNSQEVLVYHGYDPFTLKLPAPPSGSDLMSASQFEQLRKHPHLLMQDLPYQHQDTDKWEQSRQDPSRYCKQISYSCIYQGLPSSSDLRINTSAFPTSQACDPMTSHDVRIPEMDGYQHRNIFEQGEDVLFDPGHDAILNTSRDGSEPPAPHGCMGHGIASSVTDLCLMQNSYIS